MSVEAASVSPVEGRSSTTVRSCITCSKAKAKCVRLSGRGICERCARLRKDCHDREPVVRKRKLVKPSRSAQLEKLETKIEHLVNALSSSQAAQHRLQNDRVQASPPTSQDEHGSSATSNEVVSALCQDPEAPRIVRTPNCSTPVPPHASLIGLNPIGRLAKQIETLDYDALPVSMNEAELLLDRFRRLMAPALPFVLITPDMTAETLRMEKPFLLHAIVTVAYIHDLPTQQTMLRHLTRDLTERILINAERNLGILQGLVTLMCWYHPHIFWAGQMTNIMHLAMAMISDLGLDRAPGTAQDLKAATTRAVHGPNAIGRIPTLEEYRAVAGVYSITTMLASSFKRIDIVPYSRYLAENLKTLETAREYDSDLYLVQLVRLQHVAEELLSSESGAVPSKFYAKAFSADLEALRGTDPCKQQPIILQLQYLATNLVIREHAINDLLERRTKTLSPYLDDLIQCIDAVKAFISVYFSIPSDQYNFLPFSAFGGFARAFIVLTKLASLEVDGWDSSAMADTIDFVDIVEQAAARFDAATKSTIDGVPFENDTFIKWASRIRWMKSIWVGKFASGQMPDKAIGYGAPMGGVTAGPPGTNPVYYSARTPGTSTDDGYATASTSTGSMPSAAFGQMAGPGGVHQQPTPPDDVLSGDFFNYLDDNFWASFGADAELSGYADIQV